MKKDFDLDDSLSKLRCRIIVRRMRIKEISTPESWAYYYSDLDIPGKHLIDWLLIELPKK